MAVNVEFPVVMHITGETDFDIHENNSDIPVVCVTMQMFRIDC